MNPKTSVPQAPPCGPVRARLSAVLEAIERASRWQLFDIDELPPTPRWLHVASGAMLVVLGLLWLVGQLLGLVQ